MSADDSPGSPESPPPEPPPATVHPQPDPSAPTEPMQPGVQKWEAPPQYPPPAPTSGMAITGLVLGCLSIASLSCGPYAIVGIPLYVAAIIVSHIARANLHKQNPPMAGKGIALAGIILGWVSLGVCLILALVVAIFFGVAFYFMPATP